MDIMKFPLDHQISPIPNDGIYIIFEKGEKYKDWNRVVRVGTHTVQSGPASPK